MQKTWNNNGTIEMIPKRLAPLFNKEVEANSNNLYHILAAQSNAHVLNCHIAGWPRPLKTPIGTKKECLLMI